MMSYLQMVELIPGFRIYVYTSVIDYASRCSSGTGCAAYLLNAFYTNDRGAERQKSHGSQWQNSR